MSRMGRTRLKFWEDYALSSMYKMWWCVFLFGTTKTVNIQQMLAWKNVHNSSVNANFGKNPNQICFGCCFISSLFLRSAFSHIFKAHANVFTNTHTHTHSHIHVGIKEMKFIYAISRSYWKFNLYLQLFLLLLGFCCCYFCCCSWELSKILRLKKNIHIIYKYWIEFANIYRYMYM